MPWMITIEAIDPTTVYDGNGNLVDVRFRNNPDEQQKQDAIFEIRRQFEMLFPKGGPHDLAAAGKLIDDSHCHQDVAAQTCHIVMVGHLERVRPNLTTPLNQKFDDKAVWMKPAVTKNGSVCEPCGKHCHVCTSGVHLIAADGTSSELELEDQYAVGTLRVTYDIVPWTTIGSMMGWPG